MIFSTLSKLDGMNSVNGEKFVFTQRESMRTSGRGGQGEGSVDPKSQWNVVHCIVVENSPLLNFKAKLSRRSVMSLLSRLRGDVVRPSHRHLYVAPER